MAIEELAVEGAAEKQGDARGLHHVSPGSTSCAHEDESRPGSRRRARSVGPSSPMPAGAVEPDPGRCRRSPLATSAASPAAVQAVAARLGSNRTSGPNTPGHSTTSSAAQRPPSARPRLLVAAISTPRWIRLPRTRARCVGPSTAMKGHGTAYSPHGQCLCTCTSACATRPQPEERPTDPWRCRRAGTRSGSHPAGGFAPTHQHR